MPTPPLPDWILSARVPGYVTAHQLCPDETRLYGTESMYGDWDGHVLLLAKDFGPSSIVRTAIARGDPRPYSHAPAMRANRVLARLAAPLAPAGLLYGSALANLLRDDARVSGTLPNRAAALAYGAEVLRFVVARMPRRRWVACMGRRPGSAAAPRSG